MNELLKELANKSGFGPAWYDPIIPTSDIDRRWIDQRRLKEFAELIVRECATKMASEIMDKQWIDDAVKNTYKHFGVEE